MPHIDLPEGVPGIPRSCMNIPRPETAGPRMLNRLAEALLRADNSLGRGERELIAAYVSSLNDCVYCETSHSTFAAMQLEGGMPLVDRVKLDPDEAPIGDPAPRAARDRREGAGRREVCHCRGCRRGSRARQGDRQRRRSTTRY